MIIQRFWYKIPLQNFCCIVGRTVSHVMYNNTIYVIAEDYLNCILRIVEVIGYETVLNVKYKLPSKNKLNSTEIDVEICSPMVKLWTDPIIFKFFFVKYTFAVLYNVIVMIIIKVRDYLTVDKKKKKSTRHTSDCRPNFCNLISAVISTILGSLS